MSDMNTDNNLDNKKKNSFRDTVLIVFVVLVCFGLTIFAISVLLSSMSSGDLIDGDSDGNKITSDVVTPRVITDPNKGDTISIDNNNKEEMRNDTVVATPPVEAREKVVTKKEPTAKPKPVRDVSKTPAKKVVPKKAEPKAEPKADAKPVVKAEPKSTTYSEKVEPGSPTEGKFVLQLMALQSEIDANNAVKKYKVACPDIFVMKIDLKNSGTWYRVRCGITNSMDEAVALKQKLATDYKIYADLIKNQ